MSKTAVSSPTGDEVWTDAQVSRWLIDHGWGSIVHSFRDNDINGQQFLNLTMTRLSDFLPKSELGYGEKRRLIHSVQALRPSHTLQDQAPSSQPQPNPPIHAPSSRPIQPSMLDSEYARIRPYIPERKSSNTDQLSEIMKTLNIPRIESIAAVARGRQNNMTPSSERFHLEQKQGPTSPPTHGPSSPETSWKISGRRPVLYQPFHEQQRIQVTVDSDVYFSLTITDMIDSELKMSILSKLGIDTDAHEWHFYHENELTDIPLSDSELIHVCRTSDNSQTNRILVKSVHGDNGNEHIFNYNDSYRLPQRPATTSPFVRHPRYASPVYASWSSEHGATDIFDNQVQAREAISNQYSSPIGSDYHDQQGRNVFHPLHSANLREGPVNNSPSVASSQLHSTNAGVEDNQSSNPHDWISDKKTTKRTEQYDTKSPVKNGKPTHPISLWAVKPRSLLNSVTEGGTDNQGLPPQPRSVTATPALWAVPPRPASTPAETRRRSSAQLPFPILAAPPMSEPRPQPVLSSSEKSNLVTEADIDVKRLSTPSRQNNTRRLQIQIPETGPRLARSRQTSPQTSLEPLTPVTGTSASPSPPTSACHDPDPEFEEWVERPSIERLYKNIDEYLPDHDLDKEILMEQQPPPSAPRRLQGHQKSLRIVVNEAHRNWRHATNMVRVNNIFRRRSTKMWGRKVQQVKPGMEIDPVVAPKATTPTVPAGQKLAPTKLQWIRGQLIGKGSFGRVYHALNVEAGEWIAVKQVDVPTTKSDLQNDKLREAADALYREISFLGELDHENIVAYLGYDLDEEEGHINIFLEYVPGGSIATCLSNHGKFENSLVRFFTRQILLGLEYLHSRDIMHRDIKAGNILLDQNGVCKITDFGLSKLSQPDMAYDSHSSNSLMRGTVYWMAPEVVKGTNYSAKIDIWSLGCTVIEMLTGQNPWIDLNMFAALYNLGKYQPPPIPSDICEAAADFLKQCFIINPEDRPTAADLLVHPFVRQDPSFKFREHMKAIGLERKQSIVRS